MNKFPVPLLRQLLGCMQDGLSTAFPCQASFKLTPENETGNLRLRLRGV